MGRGERYLDFTQGMPFTFVKDKLQPLPGQDLIRDMNLLNGCELSSLVGLSAISRRAKVESASVNGFEEPINPIK